MNGWELLIFFFWILRWHDESYLTWNPWACRHTSGKVAVPAIWYATKTRCLWRNIENLHLSSLHNFSCEAFLLKNLGPVVFQKNDGVNNLPRWVLFAPSVCGVLHQSRQVSRQNKRQTFWASALMPLWPIDRKAWKDVSMCRRFFGKALMYRFDSYVASMFPIYGLCYEAFWWWKMSSVELKQNRDLVSVAAFVLLFLNIHWFGPIIIANKPLTGKALDDGLGLG